MKIALITTTIHVPRVLALYRKYGPGVEMFVAGDNRTDIAAEAFCEIIGANYMSVEKQRSLGYKCSEMIGWDCIQRRNIALLEALRWGADVIVSIDDDNIPVDGIYFDHYADLFYDVFSGLRATSVGEWFDVGNLLLPPVPQRGVPLRVKGRCRVSHTVDARIGVVQGMALGDPDMSAVERVANGLEVHQVSETLRAGIVFKPEVQSWTVFNTQNTAFVAELAPAMFCPPGIGRFDDIVASLICQRVMRERDYHVHFGQPFVWQQRNPHNLVKDLKDEMWGYNKLIHIARHLDSDDVTGGLVGLSVLDQVRFLYGALMQYNGLMHGHSAKAALAFCDDIEGLSR